MERPMCPWIRYSFFVHKRIKSAVRRVEFVSDRMSYMILKGCWFHIIVLNVHIPTEDRTDDLKDSFYEELEHIFGKFPKCRMNILLEEFIAKVGRKTFLNQQLGMKVYMKLVMTMALECKFCQIYKSQSKVQCSHFATFISILEYLQMAKPTIRLTIFWQTGKDIQVYSISGHLGLQTDTTNIW
jgi:hypothetical protein